MAEYCVKNKRGDVVAIYNGNTTDERLRKQAEAAAASGNYGPGCKVEVYTPPPVEQPAEDPAV